MRIKAMKIRGGVLIIGSLLWQDEQGNKPTQRKDWRRKRLTFNEKIHVKAPIRYGRESGKNGNKTYTMVFSKQAEEKNELGTAYVVPFKNRLLKSLRGIEKQARYLSEAEGMANTKLVKGNNEIWCTVGILFNPKLKNEEKKKILLFYTGLIKKDGGTTDYAEYKIGDEKSVLSSEGEILLQWIKSVDPKEQKKVDDLDFILATCTKPNLTAYPSIKQLKDAAESDSRKYFFNNIKHGINTSIDQQVICEKLT